MRGRGRNRTVPDSGGWAESRLGDPGNYIVQNPHLTEPDTEAREAK